MTLPKIDETKLIEHNYVLCVVGDSFTRLQSKLVNSIDFATTAAAIPFGTAPIEGLVINQEGACLQLDVGALCGMKAKSGKYSVNIQTSKGIVSLRVDSVSKNSLDNSCDHKTEFLCLNTIEDFLTNCETPIKKLAEKGPPIGQEKITKSIVFCRIDNRVIGLDAECISFFESPVKLLPLRAANQFTYLVELENGELLNGIDLSAALSLSNAFSANEKKWAIGIQTESERFALVTEQLIGLEQHESHLFQRLNHSATESCWLTHTQHGHVEVFDPRTFGKNKSASVEKNDSPYIDLRKSPSTPAISTQGVGIKCNKFDLVLPSTTVESVGGMIETSDLKNKPSKNMIRAYDISKLFLDETDIKANKKRLIIVKNLSKRNFALLVPDVYKSQNDKPWSVPHILPKPLGKLIKATQISEGRCELLVSDEFISELSAPEFDKFKKETFCGWLTPL